MNKLLVITTGGTIDKVYFDAKSEYEVGEPVVATVLAAMNVSYSVEVKTVCQKDSLEIDNSDREAIKKAIKQSDVKHILITHGTDTMVDTAKFIGEYEGKVIVLCGAMQPAIFKETDGIFNIGTAVGILSIANPGTYIAMNGECFKPDKVFKNYDTRRFEEK